MVRSQVLYPTELQPHAKRYCFNCRNLLRWEGPQKSGAAGRIRTHDPLVRSQVLYPTELQPHATTNFYCFELKGPSVGKALEKVARLAGFEPTTPWFVAKYSIQLSYSRTQKRKYSRVV
ncbi:hypothetical protein F01_310165 [Burkholderia cenocepacia]|nr:hypothetical protein F01_310165 [Burkholderia cenocepacia]